VIRHLWDDVSPPLSEATTKMSGDEALPEMRPDKTLERIPSARIKRNAGVVQVVPT
jgi:hypothetical protein